MDYPRCLQIPNNQSFFLFGSRGTGKSTLIRNQFSHSFTRSFDLLDLNLESRFIRDPMSLAAEVLALPESVSHVVIDEIQKAPRLLDVVHYLMESKKVSQKFILTGSSARKLKRGGANLLAGRAALRSLFPLIEKELAAEFDLQKALCWGTLPGVWKAAGDLERRDMLTAYAATYLKEEIGAEQLVRELEPFRRFSEIAARQSGKVLNYTRIGRDVGVDFKSVKSWYEVLEDTLVGFHLDAFHNSARKQLRKAPKFYFFDIGVTRALGQLLSVFPEESTSYFGDLFEQFVICDMRARCTYANNDFKLHYHQTKSGVEIDLVVARPGRPPALIEIKSKKEVSEYDAKSLLAFQSDFPDADLFLISRDEVSKQFGSVRATHWTRVFELIAE